MRWGVRMQARPVARAPWWRRWGWWLRTWVLVLAWLLLWAGAVWWAVQLARMLVALVR